MNKRDFAKHAHAQLAAGLVPIFGENAERRDCYRWVRADRACVAGGTVTHKGFKFLRFLRQHPPRPGFSIQPDTESPAAKICDSS